MATDKDIFTIKHNGLLPKQGRLLISEPLLSDAYFQRSVVLIVEHSPAGGSLGFILNKQTDLTVNLFFPELKQYNDFPIFMGGPVCANRLFFIHTLGNNIIPDAFQINENLYFDGDFEVLKEYILTGNSIEGKVKFFLGYSGWEKGQLAQEIKEESWAVGKSDNAHLFSANGDAFWKYAVNRLGTSYKNWTRFPKDVYLN